MKLVHMGVTAVLEYFDLTTILHSRLEAWYNTLFSTEYDR